ncbi:ClpXP protease specificity-enhancing factor [Neiella sp. HB171785]|uniref:ClpXP protease specificity-enhancing factor n=1 Tax=Neiella litorisoli TaxID=2771431 RepID=A0A8J6QUI9_9GAMM|nr:ClpXP protease specificity-enhancing factor [Neiella litorisoli]MBD1389917.1 ClpXP protease specificity-enhancing factor [Neiella litorisoli]
MTPSRPYLLRAFYEWLVDNDLTPHLVVDAEQPDVEVPRQFVQNGQIVLNIAPAAVSQLQMTNDVVSCSARFGGKPELLYVPMWAVKAIYARENGAGTVFEAEPGYREMLSQLDSADETAQPAAERDLPSDNGDDDKPTPPSGSRPTLRVVK